MKRFLAATLLGLAPSLALAQGAPYPTAPTAANTSGLAAVATSGSATDLTAGTVAAARGGAGTVSGAMKGNGAGTVSQAGCADLSNAASSCSTDTTNASNIVSGTLPAGRMPAASGDITRSAGSTAETVTQVNGAGCDTGFTLAPGGCIWTQNPSAVSTLSWTGLVSGEYRLSCSNVVMSAAVNLFVQFGEGGTPTWETASYHYAIQGLKETNSVANAVSTSAAGVSLNAALDATAAGLGVNFDIDIHGLQTASVNKYVHGIAVVPATGGIDATVLSIGGVYAGDTNVISAIRLNVTSGTFTGGPCTLRKKPA